MTQSKAACNDPNAYVKKLKCHWVKGPHLEFLTSHIAGFHSTTMEGPSHAQEYLDSVVNEYFSNFPWRLKTSENPTASASKQSTMEQLPKVEMEQKQCKVASMHKAIRLWFKYHIRVNQRIGGNVLDAENDMWTHLLLQLSGVKKKKPKALKAHQQWSKDHFDTAVWSDFEARCDMQGIKGMVTVSFCDQVTHEHFLATDVQTQSHYTQLTKDKAKTAIEQWTSALSPLLSGMHAILSMHITLISFQEYLDTCYMQEEHDASKLPMEIDEQTPSLPNGHTSSEAAEVDGVLKKATMPTPITKCKSKWQRQACESVDSPGDSAASSGNEDSSDTDSGRDSDNDINHNDCSICP
ncbi:hypothetical protein EDC04DRAFT_2602444 [Pisolithus marmoratus]|nr:hypothetical protein EDC04DRAFT_2602444 [Pisolithus marmoratus]